MTRSNRTEKYRVIYKEMEKGEKIQREREEV
jgi:hypothetical protein